MRGITNFKKVSATTKGMLSGDADAYVRRFQAQMDEFIEDLERFDEALWTFIHEYKGKLYHFLDMFTQKQSKDGSKSLGELKKSFTKLQSSARGVSRDFERTARAVSRRER